MRFFIYVIFDEMLFRSYDEGDKTIDEIYDQARIIEVSVLYDDRMCDKSEVFGWRWCLRCKSARHKNGVIINIEEILAMVNK